MNDKMNLVLKAALMGLVLGLTACGTVGTVATPVTVAPTTTMTAAAIEAALPLVRTGAAVATGGVLDFAVTQSSSRTRLANEMYAAASAVYSLSGGIFPTPAQLESSILAFGGSETDASYAKFSSVVGVLYTAYYQKLAAGDGKTAADLLNAIAGGIEDATQAYVTTPVVPTSVAQTEASF